LRGIERIRYRNKMKRMVMTGISFIMFQRGGGKNEESEILGAFITPSPQHPSPPSNQPPTLLLTPHHPSPLLTTPLTSGEHKKKPLLKPPFLPPQPPFRIPKATTIPTHLRIPHAHPLSRHYPSPFVPKIPISTSHFSAAQPPHPPIFFSA